MTQTEERRARDILQDQRTKEIVLEALKEHFGKMYVEPEKHYQHHLWLDGYFKALGTAKKTAIIVSISTLVTGIISFIVFMLRGTPAGK